MSLIEGDHVVKIDRQTGKPAENEVSVEFEVLGPPMHHQERGETGEFAHENYVVLLRKVR
jgi:hypothetical protein